MGFNLPGKSITSGSSAHSSALKMRESDNAASALKQMTISKDELKDTKWHGGQDIKGDVTVNATGTEITAGGKTVTATNKNTAHKAILEKRWKKGDKASGGTLNELVKQRKSLTKGTKEYADVQNKINKSLGSKKVHEGKVKQSNVSKDKNVEGKNVVKGLGDASKRLTPEQKTAEKVKLAKIQSDIDAAKVSGDKKSRDENQLKKGLVKSGEDNAKTGTVVSRWFGKRKVKRNKRQLAKRKSEENA